MPRPVRRKLKFDEESLNSLLQECYDDTFNIRSEIKSLFNKWSPKVKEGGEIQAIGDQIIKLISALAKNQDQKITLLKYLKDAVYAEKNNTKDEPITPKTEEKQYNRNELVEMVQKQMEANKEK